MRWKVWGRVFGGDCYIYAWEPSLRGIMVVASVSSVHIIDAVNRK